MRKIFKALLFPSIALAAAVPARGQAEFVALGSFIDGGNSFAYGVSADGRVVVGSAAIDFNWQTEAFVWTEESGMIGLGDLPGGGSGSVATDASDDGRIVVGYGQIEPGPQAFRWTPDDGMVAIGPPSHEAFFSYADAISGDGRVVVGVIGEQAFRWTLETDLEMIPGFKASYSEATDVSRDGEVIVGFRMGDVNGYAVRWTAKTGAVSLGDLPGGKVYASATGLTRDGAVVVGTGSVEAGREAFRWTAKSGLTPLGELPGCHFESRATAVSDDGSAIVGTSDICTDSAACRWTPVDGLRDIRRLLLDRGVSEVQGWSLQFAKDISADGTVIVGYGTNPRGAYEAWLVRLPLPCPGDCDSSGNLDVLDFACFLDRFVALDPLADCDASGALDLFDFLCFVNAFNAGC